MEAERFLEDFRERLVKFGLELHPEKTRVIEFERFAAQNRKQRGESKPSRRPSPFWGSRIIAERPEGWSLHRVAHNGEEADVGEAAGSQGRTGPPPPSAEGRSGRVVTKGHFGLLPLSCCPG